MLRGGGGVEVNFPILLVCFFSEGIISFLSLKSNVFIPNSQRFMDVSLFVTFFSQDLVPRARITLTSPLDEFKVFW